MSAPRIARGLLVVLLTCVLVSAWTPAARAEPRIRIKYEGAVPPGWTMEAMPTDEPEYVGFRAIREIRDESNTIRSWARVESYHQWWQNYGATEEYANGFAKQRLEALREDAQGEFQGDTGIEKIGGRDFGFVRWTDTPPDGSTSGWTIVGREYYSALEDGSAIEIKVYSTEWSDDAVEELSARANEIFNGFRYDFTIDPKEAQQEPAAPTEQPGSPWRTVTEGAAAVAAAAAAIFGAAASARSKKTRLDPNKPIGYVLDLSTGKLELASASSTELKAAVWRVLASGQVEPADEAQVTLVAPKGVQASPASGAQPLVASVWQDGDPAPGSAMLVRATASKGGTQSRVELVPEGASELVLVVRPAGAKLRPTGRDVLMVAAHLRLSLRAQADPAVDNEAARASITFAQPTSVEWLDVGETRDIPAGKEMPVSMSTPDPNKQLTPPESVIVRATAAVGKEPLSASVVIPVERPPVIDARPDTVQLAAGSKAGVDVLVWIDGGEGEWDFRAELAKQDRKLIDFEVEGKSGASAMVRITEAAGPLPPTNQPTETATLRVIATHSTYDQLERHIKIIVVREGVFLDTVTLDRDGTYHVAADGGGKPTDIDVRVYLRDPASGEIVLDKALSESLTVEPADDVAARTVRAALLVRDPAGMRPSNNPAAIHRFHTERLLPTDGKPVPVRFSFRVEGREEPQFNAVAPLALIGVNTAPFSPAWDLEMERCRKIVNDFIPAEDRSRFHIMLNERGKLMGAEGLYELRKRIWSYAAVKFRQEINEQLDRAWELQQIEDCLDWVSWCGDIAFGVASGTLVGTAASVGLGMLKPMLVSAMTCYVDGKDLGDWAWEQVGILGAVVEGCATDVDLIATKLTGENKVLAWAAFIAYTFAREIQRDPNHSVTAAMKNIMSQLRDEGLIQFLLHFAMKGGKAPKPGAGAADGPGASKPPPPDADGAPVGGKTPPPPDADGAPVGGKKLPPPGAEGAPGASKGGAPDGTEPPVSKPPHGDGPEPPGPKPTDAPPSPDVVAEPAPKPPRTPPAPGSVVKPGPGAKKQTSPAKPAERAPEFEAPDARDRASKMADAVKTKTTPGSKGPQVDADTMEKIMRDPDAARELKKNDPKAWKAYDNARQQTYEKHDTRLEAWIEKTVPEAKGQQVEVRSVGTPDGVDRDYRAGIVRKDPMTHPITGKEVFREVFIEIPKEKWAGESQAIFSEVTGGPRDPAEAAAWSKQHQQLATDGYHSEAAVDMADQGMIKNPQTGQWEKSQITPNIELVKKGKSTLLDPDGVGKTYETKVANSYREGAPLDAYTQAEKAVVSFVNVKTGYMAQDFKMKPTPPEIIRGFQIIQDVAAGKMGPEAGDAALSAAGVGSNLPEFMSKLSGQFASFKFAGK